MFDKPNLEPLYRGRRSIGVDLKNPEGVELVLRLVEQADALVEGFRPGVTERLGLGPDVCLARNPKLVYGRMTGWGQDGPMAQAAGHDINYIALAGALAHFGRAGGKPTPPINLVGDFGGGGMFMAFGIVCGVLEAQRSGKGQVIDVAMVDGTAILMSMMWGLKQIGFWDEALGAERARHRRAVLRHLRDGRRQVRLARFARAAVLRRADPEARPRERGPARADGPQRLGHAARRGSPSCSRRRRATSGTRSSRAATRATRRCSR